MSNISKDKDSSQTQPMAGDFRLETHDPLAQYGLMAKGSNENYTVLELDNSDMQLTIARIPKEYLGVDTSYQRPISKSKIKNLQKKWDNQVCDPVVVFAREIEGKTYYQVVDGQHRSCACPEDKVTCRVISVGEPIEHYKAANDPKTKSGLPEDASTWVAKQMMDRGRVCGEYNEYPLIYETIDIMNSHGFVCQSTYSKEKDFGVKWAKLYNNWYKECYQKFEVKARQEFPQSYDKKTKTFTCEKSRNWIATKSLKVWEQMFDIMIEAFGASSFTPKKFAGEMWPALCEILTKSERKYSPEKVKQAICSGLYRPLIDVRQPIKRMVDLSHWIQTQVEFHTGRVQNNYRELIRLATRLHHEHKGPFDIDVFEEMPPIEKKQRKPRKKRARKKVT